MSSTPPTLSAGGSSCSTPQPSTQPPTVKTSHRSDVTNPMNSSNNTPLNNNFSRADPSVAASQIIRIANVVDDDETLRALFRDNFFPDIPPKSSPDDEEKWRSSNYNSSTNSTSEEKSPKNGSKRARKDSTSTPRSSSPLPSIMEFHNLHRPPLFDETSQTRIHPLHKASSSSKTSFTASASEGDDNADSLNSGSESDGDSENENSGDDYLDDYNERGVRRECGDCNDFNESDEETDYLTNTPKLSPNGEMFSLATASLNSYLQRNATTISNMNKPGKKLVSSSFNLCSDVVGAFLMGVLLKCEVFSWVTDTGQNSHHFSFLAKARKFLKDNLSEFDIENDQNLYLHAMSNLVKIRLVIVKKETNDNNLYNVTTFGDSTIKSHIYVKSNNTGNSFKTVVRVSYKNLPKCLNSVKKKKSTSSNQPSNSNTPEAPSSNENQSLPPEQPTVTANIVKKEKKNSDEKVVVRRLGVQKTVTDPANKVKFAKASDWVSEVTSSAYELLNLVAALVGGSSEDTNDPSHINKYFPGFSTEGDTSSSLFNEKFLRSLLSVASSTRDFTKAVTEEFPVIKVVVSMVYYDAAGNLTSAGVARERLADGDSCPLQGSILLNYAAKEMLVAVNNWYTIGQAQHQKSFFMQNFYLLSKVAKVFQRRVGVSQQDYLNDVASHFAKSRATEIRYIKHTIVELSKINPEDNNEKLKKKEEKIRELEVVILEKIEARSKFDANALTFNSPLFLEAEKEFVRSFRFKGENVEDRTWRAGIINESKSSVNSSSGSSKASNKRQKVSTLPSDIVQSKTVNLLLEYVSLAKSNLPLTSGQFALTKYRYEMMQSLDMEVRSRNKNVTLPTFAPTSKMSPAFITVDKTQLPKLIELQEGRAILKRVTQNVDEKELNFIFRKDGYVLNKSINAQPHVADSTKPPISIDNTNQSTAAESAVSKSEDASEADVDQPSVIDLSFVAESPESKAEDASEASYSRPPSPTSEWAIILRNINLHDAMPSLFDKNIIKRFVANRMKDKKKRFFSPTFQIDPVQLCLKVITEDKVADNNTMQDNKKKKKLANAEERKKKEKEAEEAKEKEVVDDSREGGSIHEIDTGKVTPNENAPPIGPDAKTKTKMWSFLSDKFALEIAKKEYEVQKIKGSFWGIDFGLRNMICAAHSENAFSPIVISRKQFNSNVGVSSRSFSQNKKLKERLKSDATFKAAVSDRTNKHLRTPDLALLTTAVISRIGNFSDLYSFYGDPKFALDRFLNKNRQDREFARIVDLLFVGNVTNIVCGDATMPNGLKGSQTSLDKKFCAYVERVKGSGTVIFCTEHRTSVLDSNTRKKMYHPRMKLSKKKLEKRRLRNEGVAGEANVAPIDDMDVDVQDPPAASWGGGGDRIAKLAEIGSDGAGIFRQERKAKKEGEGGGEKEKEGGNDLSSVWGLYQVSMPGYSYLWNRDINAAINIANIYLHFLEYGVAPWEFQRDVELMKIPDYIPAKTDSLAIN